jgi:hypothetical protein
MAEKFPDIGGKGRNPSGTASSLDFFLADLDWSRQLSNGLGGLGNFLIQNIPNVIQVAIHSIRRDRRRWSRIIVVGLSQFVSQTIHLFLELNDLTLVALPEVFLFIREIGDSADQPVDLDLKPFHLRLKRCDIDSRSIGQLGQVLVGLLNQFRKGGLCQQNILEVGEHTLLDDAGAFGGR